MFINTPSRKLQKGTKKFPEIGKKIVYLKGLKWGVDKKRLILQVFAKNGYCGEDRGCDGALQKIVEKCKYFF